MTTYVIYQQGFDNYFLKNHQFYIIDNNNQVTVHTSIHYLYITRLLHKRDFTKSILKMF